MKLITYLDGGAEQVGVLSPDTALVYPVHALGFSYKTMLDLIAKASPLDLARLASGAASSPSGVPIERIQLTAPIPRPKHDLVCVGKNYKEHAAETARFTGGKDAESSRPVFFSKRVTAPLGDGADIPAHTDITDQLDYETELAVVIGKTCSHVAPERVFEYIFGYTIVNDVSARNVQFAHEQYYFGKSLDGFAPMGPWIVTADEFATPPELAVRTRVNGELRQNDNTRNFLFSIPVLISTLSAGMTLEPGDVLVTGTPAGVGMGSDPPKFLRVGDTIECEVEGIGVLRNTVR